MDSERKALCARLATSLRRCDADRGSPFARGLLANGTLDAAGVREQDPVDYEAFAAWLMGGTGGGRKESAARRVVLGEEQSCEEAGEVMLLDVGGHHFRTTFATIEMSPPGSLLRQLLSRPRGSGVHFIDRDGRQFHHVLNFLRDGAYNFVAPVELCARRELYREACHYRLFELALGIQNAYLGAPQPSNEESRLKRLEGLGIMHTADSEAEYDCLTQVVKALLGMPIVLISLVGDDHQWFKSRCGLAATQTPKNTSFCAFSFLRDDPEVLIVEDAVNDPRTCHNPLVIGEPNIGFYAGCPLVTSDGFRLGALCVIDHVPRKLEQWQFQVLTSFAHLAVQEIQRSELEKLQPLVETLWEEVEDRSSSLPSSGNSAAARREAWRSQELSPQPGVPYGHGMHRLARMKEAMQEIVCLVQVNCTNMHWPILYANRTWRQFTAVEVHTPDCILNIDLPVCKDRKSCPWPNLWKTVSLEARQSPESLLRCTREAWEKQPQPHTFSLSGSMATVQSGATGRSGRVWRQVSCRFVPVHQALDVAAGAVGQPRPPEPSIKPSCLHPDRSVPECYLYFVLMVFCDDGPTKEPPSPSVTAADVLTGIYEDDEVNSSATSDAEAGAAEPPAAAAATPSKPVLEQAGLNLGVGSVHLAGRQVSQDSTNSNLLGMQLRPARSPFVDVKLRKRVGQGSFGKVYYGHWLGSPVAVKVVQWRDRGSLVKPLFEAELSCTLSHPNLVQTFKYATATKGQETPEPGAKSGDEDKEATGNKATFCHTWIVQEWCDAGTLKMHCSHPRYDAAGHFEALQIANDITSAGSYLHSRGIIHGDLTANNILLCKTHVAIKGYVCKICDFGLGGILEGESTGFLMDQLATITHMPPELLVIGTQMELTTKADVYATGVLLWQAICGQIPWKSLPPSKIMAQMARGKRLRLPGGTPRCTRDIFTACTADEPSSRPTMDELAESLHQALQNQQLGEEQDDEAG